MNLETFLIHEINHALVYTIIASIYLIIKNKDKIPIKNFLVGLAVTILLDADHLVDYFIYKKSFVFNIKEFFGGTYFFVNNTTYVPLHAWEWVAAILIFYLLTKKRYEFLIFIAIAIAAQIIFDTISYHFDPRAYFIIFRFMNHFRDTIFNL